MNLTGAWETDASDARALSELGDVLLEFGENGDLIYTICGQEKNQVMKLRYSVEGSSIVTDQPSRPRIERTEFLLEGDTLTLAFGGVPYRFVRA